MPTTFYLFICYYLPLHCMHQQTIRCTITSLTMQYQFTELYNILPKKGGRPSCKKPHNNGITVRPRIMPFLLVSFQRSYKLKV